MSFEEVRRRVLRRLRYAANTHVLEDDKIPAEGPYDTALTNALLCIVAEEWPGQEWQQKNPTRAKSARELLEVISAHGGLSEVDEGVLGQALDLTQPFRHGTADDEWAAIGIHHLQALHALDDHPALRVLRRTKGLKLDASIVMLYGDLGERELPFDPKERSDVPDPEECPECWRETFLPEGWDMYGVTTLTAGHCVACGYERKHAEAADLANDAALDRAMKRPD